MHAIHAHISTGTHTHSCEHRYIPPHTHTTHLRCTQMFARRKNVQVAFTQCVLHVYAPRTNATQRTQAHRIHTHAHRSLSCRHRHACTHTHHIHNLTYPCTTNPRLQVYTVLLPLPSPLLFAHPPLPVPASLAILTLWLFTGQSPTSPSWTVRCRWNLLTVFCASSLPFFCFLGWRS